MKWLIGSIIFIAVIIIAASMDFFTARYVHGKKTRLSSYPVRRGHLQLITSGPDLFSHYFNDLYKAESSIHVLFYIVKKDRFSQLFFEILIDQARKGVKVRLLLDWFGSREVSKKLIKQARSAGVEVTFCHRPRLPFFFFSLQQRNHRKVTIIDGKIGYVGGFNVGKEYIDLDPVLSPWRDYHLRVQGEGIADLQTEFLLDWKQATGVCHLEDLSLFPILENGPMFYRFFPTRGVNAEEEILQLINQAEKRIFIGTPYFIPPEKLMEGLLKAIQRGIAVSILVPNKSDHPIVKEASLQYLHRLLAVGGTVYQYEEGFFHAKVILIDGRICDIGTANFDYRSFRLNYEINCFIYNQEFIQEAERIVQEDIDLSSRLSLEDLVDPPFSFRLKGWMGMLLKRFL
ncbi:cardiolipin synthase [Bacillus norwichensis]|uniref:Cardiolipin synthase n=1 Tax=Bacillus norwichensis TaxID=2762217 RepID=A0ABR8VI13_9BACI|nr:cardiolipin synthase [Bacillus norwichensis]MBD8004424.1 cardiolipin synthase [Bacillus norwichensis]